MINYKYTIEGTNGNYDKWSVSGTIETVRRGDFPEATNTALKQGFLKVLHRQASYENPNGNECGGPYSITKFTIEEIENADTRTGS